MTFLDRIQADLKKVMQDRQHEFVVEVLRRRMNDMTLGDLRRLLSSPLGQNLDSVRLANLLPAAPPAPAPTAKPAAPSRRAKAKPSAKKRRSVRKPKATADSVQAVLVASKVPLSSSEIGAKLNIHRTTVLQALRQLRGRIATHGSSKFTRYSVKPDTSKTSARPAPTTTRAKNPPPANRDDFDARVLRALPATGQTTSSAIQAVVGDTADHVREALRRLVAAGKVIHTGLRNKSRYELRPTTP